MGKDDFGEIFDGYVPNLMMLLSIRNSSHWYGGRYVEKVKYMYCAREKNIKMMSRANLISMFRIDVQQ